MFNVLVIDDDPIVRAVLKRTLQNQGYETTVVSNGIEGLAQAKILRPALIVCDWMMNPIDGIEVCRQVKSDPELSTTFFVLLTAKGEVEDRVIGLDAGADEFLSKPVDMNELKARVRAGLRLYQVNEDLRNQKQALETLNQTLNAQLAEAAEYVQSLLPTSTTGNVTIETLFKPSAQLGGDCFDFFKLDEDTLAFYLLDVSGHGVGSALLSVSVLNILRSQSLSQTNFYQPSEVLTALNQAFQMEQQGDKYFTIWYGVYERSKRRLIYATGGHPPAILLSGTSDDKIQVKQLGIPSMPVGILEDGEFDDEYCQIEENSALYIFSDGAYEIYGEDGQIWGLDAFTDLLTTCRQSNITDLEQVVEKIKILTAKDTFDDDLSLLKIRFG
jgi:sigma-B regulation protein RsbU (phosphoserine phosphatase)